MQSAKSLLLVLLAFISLPSYSQVVTNIPQTKSDKSYFFYEVKLIDEFIERFNDEPNSYIRRQSRNLYGTDTFITRRQLIKSLFNKKQQWGQEVNLFTSAVTDTTDPLYLSFTDSNWYVLAQCVFLHNDKRISLPLVMHITTVDGGSKWMIAGIGNASVFDTTLPPGLPTEDYYTTTGDYIPTSSHGTNFVTLTQLLTKSMHPADYMEPYLMATARGSQFTELVRQEKLRFKHVTNMTFHFFTIPGWLFSVSNHKRKEDNRGWLISSLQQVDAQTEAKLKLKFISNPDSKE
jgi:hypothetical protein